MSISFKKFAEYVALPGDPSDEQITEIFGLFKNNVKIEKLKAEREKLKKDTAKKEPDASMKDADDKEDPKNQQRKPGQPRSAAAADRATERDWMQNLATESTEDLYSKINDAAASVGTMKELTSKVRDRIIHHLSAKPSLVTISDADILELLRKADGPEKFALRVAMKVIGRKDPSE